MLPIRCEKLYTPPSSPASLSCSFRGSSPPSSPTTELLSLDLELDDGEMARATRILDPFAGSYRTKRASSPSSQGSPNKRRRHQPYELEDEISLANSDAYSFMEQDASVWEEAVEKAFSTGLRSIDLS